MSEGLLVSSGLHRASQSCGVGAEAHGEFLPTGLTWLDLFTGETLGLFLEPTSACPADAQSPAAGGRGKGEASRGPSSPEGTLTSCPLGQRPVFSPEQKL